MLICSPLRLMCPVCLQFGCIIRTVLWVWFPILVLKNEAVMGVSEYRYTFLGVGN